MPRLALTLLLLLLVAAPAQAELSVLFIGNSHTGSANLTSKFQGLATAAGHLTAVQTSVVGGSTLSYHSHHQPTLDLIESRVWDLVILQEHTRVTVIPYWIENSFYPAAARLDSIITASGSETALFAHWAYQDAQGPYCILDECSREFSDYFDMQAEMSAAFGPLADLLQVPAVLVGDAWAAALQAHPDLPLWGADQLHASNEGAYLAACVLVASLLDINPVGLDYLGRLDAETALFYQQLAWEFVADPTVATLVPQPMTLTSHPNPFNPATRLAFELAAESHVRLEVFDLRGRRVAGLLDESRPAGHHAVTWQARHDDGRGLASGVYVARLQAGDRCLTRRLTLVR